MNNEFKKIKTKNETRYVLETVSAGVVGTDAIATSTSKIGELRRRLQELKDKISVPKSKPRNPVGMGTTQGRGTKRHQDTDRKKSRDEKKLSVGENHEMDHEISMASNELKSIAKDAVNLLMIVKQKSEEEGLQAWQQSKITKAADFMNSVLQSVRGDEEQSVAEGSYYREPSRSAERERRREIGQEQEPRYNRDMEFVKFTLYNGLTKKYLSKGGVISTFNGLSHALNVRKKLQNPDDWTAIPAEGQGLEEKSVNEFAPDSDDKFGGGPRFIRQDNEPSNDGKYMVQVWDDTESVSVAVAFVQRKGPQQYIMYPIDNPELEGEGGLLDRAQEYVDEIEENAIQGSKEDFIANKYMPLEAVLSKILDEQGVAENTAPQPFSSRGTTFNQRPLATPGPSQAVVKQHRPDAAVAAAQADAQDFTQRAAAAKSQKLNPAEIILQQVKQNPNLLPMLAQNLGLPPDASEDEVRAQANLRYKNDPRYNPVPSKVQPTAQQQATSPEQKAIDDVARGQGLPTGLSKEQLLAAFKQKLDAEMAQNMPKKITAPSTNQGVAEGLIGDVVVHNYTKMPIDLKPGQAQIHGWGPNDQPIYRVKGADGKEVITSNKKKMIMVAQGQGVAEGSYTTEKQILTRIRQIMHDRKLSGTESNAGELNKLKQQLKDMRSQKNVAEGDWGWDDPQYERPKHERNPDWDREHEQGIDRPKINLRPSQDVIDAEKKAAQIKQAELQRTMAALARMRGDTSEDVAEDDPLAARQKYAEKHGQGQVYKSTYPGDKKGMTKAYAYDIKRTGPKGPLPKEEGVSEEDNAKSYQGKGNHRPGWMLKADPELAKKFKEKEDLAKKRQAAYGDPTAGKSVGEGLRDPKDNPCWKGYKPVGTKKKGGRTVPNCVPKEGMDVEESGLQYHTGVKKHGKEYMVKAAQAARKGASQAELGALKDKYSKAYKNKQNEDTYVSKLQGMLEQLKKN